MREALLGFAGAVDAISRRAGWLAAALTPVLVAVLIVNVALRYGLGRGFIELEELQWHLFAAAFLLAFADTYAADAHVRVDLLHARFSPRAKAWVEIAGCLLLLLPFAAITTVWAWDFFAVSWSIGERSSMPSGLPARWAIKFVLFFSMALLALQALAVAARKAAFLLGGEKVPGGEKA